MSETYHTVQGDTWDMIAYKVYKDEKLAGFLMEQNLLFIDYLIFPNGITLVIPEPPQDIDDNLPIWRD